MSFYLLPSVSYQTQQKMKKNLEDKRKAIERQKKLRELRENGEDIDSFDIQSTISNSTQNTIQTGTTQSSNHPNPIQIQQRNQRIAMKDKAEKEKLERIERIERTRQAKKEREKQPKRGLFGRKKKDANPSPSPTPIKDQDNVSIKSDTQSINNKFFRKKSSTPTIQTMKSIPSINDSVHSINSIHSINSVPNSIQNSIPNSVPSINEYDNDDHSIKSAESSTSQNSRFSKLSKISTNLNPSISSSGTGTTGIKKLISGGKKIKNEPAYNYNFNTDLKEILQFEKNNKKMPRSRQMSVVSNATTNSGLTKSNNSASSLLQTPTPTAITARERSDASGDGGRLSKIKTNSTSNFINSLPFDLNEFPFILKLTSITPDNVAKISNYPEYQINKYKNFLQFQENHHDYDSLTFSEIRTNSLVFFAKNFERHGTNIFRLKFYFQNFLMGKRIKINEELLQINFINYLKKLEESGLEDGHLVSLPIKLKSDMESDNSSIISSEKSESGRHQSISKNDYMGKMNRILTEFSLIEMYAIQVIRKFNCNTSINPSIERLLISQFNTSLAKFNSVPNNQISNFSPVKILNYNNSFSSQLSWQLGFDLPYAEIYESGAYNEPPNLFVDTKMGKIHPPQSSILDDEDHTRCRDFMTNLDITSQPTLAQKQKFHNQKGSSSDMMLKPINCFNIDKSLLEVPSNTFNYIQSRDLFYQIKATQTKIIMSEFLRILKPGGVIELPLVDIKSMDSKSPEYKAGLSKLLNFLENDLGFVTNSQEIVVQLLKDVGFSEVKWCIVSMNSQSSYNDYLNKFLQFRLFDVVGFDKLSCVWNAQVDEDNYCVHILAKK